MQSFCGVTARMPESGRKGRASGAGLMQKAVRYARRQIRIKFNPPVSLEEDRTAGCVFSFVSCMSVGFGIQKRVMNSMTNLSCSDTLGVAPLL